MPELSLKRFEELLDFEEKRTETIRTYLKAARLFKAWLKKRPMDANSAISFSLYLKKEYRTRQGTPLRPSSLRTYQAGLRSLYRLSKLDFPEEIKTPAVVLPEPVYLTREDYEKLYKKAENDLERAMLTTIYAVGARISEAVSRTVGDLRNWDMQGKEALYIGKDKKGVGDKTNNPGIIPLTLSSVDDLRVHMSENERKLGRKLRASDPLLIERVVPVTNNKGRTVMTPYPVPTRTANDIWHRMLKRAGIDAPEGAFFGWHAIRHTRATHLRMEKTPLEDIGAMLRHRSPQTTLRYAHTDTEALRESVRGKDPLEKQYENRRKGGEVL